MSNERLRRVRDVYNRFEAHRSGILQIPPLPLMASDVYRHSLMDVESQMMSSRNRRHAIPHNVASLLMPTQPMEVDQPADLSVKREPTNHSSFGIDLSQNSTYNRHSSSSSNRNMHRSSTTDVTDDCVLDLANRPPRTSSERPAVQAQAPPEPKENSNLKFKDEIIVLSDEESAKDASSMNGHEVPLKQNLVLKELSAEEVGERQKLIFKLKENLRCEEMKLVLLKKLQLSHQIKDNIAAAGNQVQAAPAAASALGTASSKPNNKVRVAEQPPPLLRAQNSLLKSANVHQNLTSNSHARSHNAHGPPPLIQNHNNNNRSSNNSSSNQQHLHHHHHHHHQRHQMIQQSTNLIRNNKQQQQISTPPNVVMGFPINPHQSQINCGSSQSQSHEAQQVQRGVETQSPAQRQAAAKLALRKQLEKTLLQIPPPKPPPPELHFIPNPSNTEFIYLIGLESVVNFITEGDKSQEGEAPKPFSCVQCVTDFTPVWKWENTKKGTVICEQCVTSNIKKALKAEHTNRLKTAFVKALQQEQEIEQRMAHGGAATPSPPPAATTQPPPTTTTPAPTVTHVMSLPKMSEPLRLAHASPSHQQLLRLPMNHQPLPAHMLAPLNPFLAQAYQYQLLGKNSAELQRQYLLDMIPPRSLSQQGPIN